MTAEAKHDPYLLERTPRDLIHCLHISNQELGRMFNVPTAVAITMTHFGFLLNLNLEPFKEASVALDLLLDIIEPEHLADVIRRPALVFDNRSALDLILEGRIAEVAQSYARAFTYQG